MALKMQIWIGIQTSGPTLYLLSVSYSRKLKHIFSPLGNQLRRKLGNKEANSGNGLPNILPITLAIHPFSRKY